MYVYSWVGKHTSLSFLCQLRGLKSSDIPDAMPTPRTQILVSNTFSHNRNQGLEKWLVPGHRHEAYKTIPEPLVEPESEKVLENRSTATKADPW